MFIKFVNEKENDTRNFNANAWFILSFKDRIDILKTFNIVCATIHLLSFIGFFILTILFSTIYSVNFFSSPTTDFVVYDSTVNTFVIDLVALPKYNPLWVIVWFPLITSLFHWIVVMKTTYTQYIYSVVIKGVHPLRWIEYSITAGFMTWVIWIQSGGTNVLQGILLVSLNIIMNILGWIHERINQSENVPTIGEFKVIMDEERKRDQRQQRQSVNKLSQSQYTALFTLKKTDYLPLILGFFAFIMIWVVILLYFFFAVASRASEVPWFVWTIDIGLFIQFLQFGLVMVIHFYARDYVYKYGSDAEALSFKNRSMFCCSGKGIYYFFADRVVYEISYLLLSLTSKLFLTWIVGGGVLSLRS
jgi:hypothetical protein